MIEFIILLIIAFLFFIAFVLYNQRKNKEIELRQKEIELQRKKDEITPKKENKQTLSEDEPVTVAPEEQKKPQTKDRTKPTINHFFSGWKEHKLVLVNCVKKFEKNDKSLGNHTFINHSIDIIKKLDNYYRFAWKH